jgi:hypothetical protein
VGLGVSGNRVIDVYGYPHPGALPWIRHTVSEAQVENKIVLSYGEEMVAIDRHRIVAALMKESLVDEHGEVYVSELLFRLAEIVWDKA